MHRSSLRLAMVSFFVSAATHAQTTKLSMNYVDAAREVTDYLQDKYALPGGLYAQTLTNRSPDFMWGNGITFSAFVGAARHDPKKYGPVVDRFFTALNRYWDAKVKIPGYEPSPTRGNGNDKYYDDNQWMVLTFIEAFELTGQQRYRNRALETLRFSLSGWDDQLGGGIWWHEGHKDGSKNTCSNAPAAVACLVVARTQTANVAKENIEWARKIVNWTVEHLEAEDGLFGDNIKVESHEVNRGRLTYNTALMIRAYAGLYRATQDEHWLDKAKRAATNSDWFLSDKTGAYRDDLKWSHLMVEADLEMYRLTGDAHLLERAKKNADYMYGVFKNTPPVEAIEIASIARTLWLMADVESDVGIQFWKRVEGERKSH